MLKILFSNYTFALEKLLLFTILSQILEYSVLEKSPDFKNSKQFNN